MLTAELALLLRKRGRRKGLENDEKEENIVSYCSGLSLNLLTTSSLGLGSACRVLNSSHLLSLWR